MLGMHQSDISIGCWSDIDSISVTGCLWYSLIVLCYCQLICAVVILQNGNEFCTKLLMHVLTKYRHWIDTCYIEKPRQQYQHRKSQIGESLSNMIKFVCLFIFAVQRVSVCVVSQTWLIKKNKQSHNIKISPCDSAWITFDLQTSVVWPASVHFTLFYCIII